MSRAAPAAEKDQAKTTAYYLVKRDSRGRGRRKGEREEDKGRGRKKGEGEREERTTISLCEGLCAAVTVRVEDKPLLYGSFPGHDEPHVTFFQ